MRNTGIMHPTDGVPVPPDTVNTLLVAGSSGQAMDWPTNTQFVRISGFSTAGVSLNFMANLYSTACSAPASGSSASSTGVNHPIMGSASFQIPGASTGFSVAALTSGYILVECWKK
jgi:hypothetical protein